VTSHTNEFARCGKGIFCASRLFRPRRSIAQRLIARRCILRLNTEYALALQALAQDTHELRGRHAVRHAGARPRLLRAHTLMAGVGGRRGSRLMRGSMWRGSPRRGRWQGSFARGGLAVENALVPPCEDGLAVPLDDALQWVRFLSSQRHRMAGLCSVRRRRRRRTCSRRRRRRLGYGWWHARRGEAMCGPSFGLKAPHWHWRGLGRERELSVFGVVLPCLAAHRRSG
jgi:hypothetical protein